MPDIKIRKTALQAFVLIDNLFHLIFISEYKFVYVHLVNNVNLPDTSP